MVLISLGLWNYALWTIVICLLLFLLLCIVALVIENCSYKKFRNTFCKKIYKNIDQVYSNYPHALIKYCRVHDITFSRDKYDYKLKDALEISKVKRDSWESEEKAELERINNEYNEIESKYPHGLSVAKNEFRTDNKEVLILKESFIRKMQQQYDNELFFNKLEDDQQAFSDHLAKIVCNEYGTKTFVTNIGLSKKDRNGVISNGVYNVIYSVFFETTTSNEIDITSLPFGWDILRESISRANYNNEKYICHEDTIVSLVRSINKKFDSQVNFVVGNIDSISHIDINETDIKYTNFISKLQLEGIKAITTKELLNKIELNSNRIIFISEVIESKRLYEVIKELQNLKPYENLCIACIASIINHGTAMARKRIDEEKKIEKAMHLITDFNTAIQTRSIDDIKRLYAESIKLIAPMQQHPLISRGLKTIEDKYYEFEKHYSEGIILNEEIAIVNYSAPTEYQHIDIETYWNVIFPKFGTSIFPYIRKKVNRRGYSEELFEDFLSKYLSDTTILSDAAIRISENMQYEPDIAIIYDKDYHIHIDIEIDEPYSGYDRKPIHYKNNPADLYRDLYFTNAGWIVVRFAEEQIIKSPLNCILIISRLLHAIDRTYTINQSLFTELSNSDERFKLITKWSIEDSQNMAADNYREKYLNISSFGKVENEEKSPHNCQLTEVEKRLSNEISAIINLGLIHNNTDIAKTFNAPIQSHSTKQTSKEESHAIDLAKDSIIPAVKRTHPKPEKSAEVLSIGQIMQYYFKGINHKHIADLKSHGNKNIENSILLSLEVEELKREIVYRQIQNISNKVYTTCFTIQHRGQTFDDIDISKELALISQFMQAQGNYPKVAGKEIIDTDHMVKALIGCIYGNKLYDFNLETEYYGGDWGKSVLVHIGDVPNERNDIIASIKAYLVEKHLGITIMEIHTVTIDTNNNKYSIRRARRRRSEVQRLLREIQLSPITV